MSDVDRKLYAPRPAIIDDVPELHTLITASVRGLSLGVYNSAQIESALEHVFGVDTQLIHDGTYYVIVDAAGRIAAAGGWSRRRTLFGGDQTKHGPDPLLDPQTEAARIRAFFVHPDDARRGLGRLLFAECQAAARAAGFSRMELAATLPGEPLYAVLGFTVTERFSITLPDGVNLPLARMTRRL